MNLECIRILRRIERRWKEGHKKQKEIIERMIDATQKFREELKR